MAKEDDAAVPVGHPSDVRPIAVTAAGLVLVSLVALASGGSPWHVDGGGRGIPVDLIRVLAASTGALVAGALLVVWAGTPSTAKRRRAVPRFDPRALDELGASLSAAGRAAAIVAAAIGVFALLSLPFLVPNEATAPSRVVKGNVPPSGQTSTSASSVESSSTALTWLVAGSAVTLLLLAPAAVVVRRRRARRAREAVVPDAAARVGDGLRRSLDDLESEPDPRRAVERAYARMEESLGTVELARAADETPTEFTTRVLRVLGGSAASASDLTDLFEIARFSHHPMDEDDRRRAIEWVRRLEEEVASH